MGKWHNEFLSCDKICSVMILEWLLSKRFLKHIAQNVSDDVRMAETASPGFKTGWQNFTDGISNWWKGFTGSGLTQRDVDMNAMNMQNVEDTAAAQVAGYQKAGVNTALMYGNGASNSAPQASSTGSVGNMSELIQLLTLPSQIQLMKAQASNTQANTAKVEMETQKTEVDKDIAIVERSLKHKENQYASKFYAARAAYEDAKSNESKQSAAASAARAAYDAFVVEYAKEHNGALPSSSQVVALAEYIGSLLGVKDSDVKEVSDTIVETLTDSSKKTTTKRKGLVRNPVPDSNPYAGKSMSEIMESKAAEARSRREARKSSQQRDAERWKGMIRSKLRSEYRRWFKGQWY